MAMRARGRSTPRPGSSATCSFAPKTTCRSPTARRRPIYFHALRRQMKRDFRKPLILMTPKSLLRHKRAVSTLGEIRAGIDVPPAALGRCAKRPAPKTAIKLVPDDKIRRVVLCSGKVYYDLLRGAREARHQRRLPAARRTALSVPGQGAARRAQPVQERRNGVVPGRAQEHGRLGFVQPYLDWVLDADRRAKHSGRAISAVPASASTGHGPDVEAPGATRRRSSTKRRSRMTCSRPTLKRTARTEQMATDNPRAHAGRMRHRGDDRPMVQEGRRRHRCRRAGGRTRDRQGHHRGAGAIRRHARRRSRPSRAKPSTSVRCSAPSAKPARASRPRSREAVAQAAGRSAAATVAARRSTSRQGRRRAADR